MSKKSTATDEYYGSYARSSVIVPRKVSVPHVVEAARSPTELRWEAAEARNKRTWTDLLETDSELARIEIGIAQAGRTLATDHPGSATYSQALLEDRRLRDKRLALWRARHAQ